MKLELIFPERPGLLHALPVCDILLMLWIAFLLGTALTRQSGVSVEMPSSQFQLDRYRNSLVVTLASGETGPRLYLGRDAVSFEQLREELTRFQDQGAPADTLVLLRTDHDVPSGAQRRVEEMALALDFQVALVGSDAEPVSAVAPGAAKPQPGAE